MLLVRDVTGPSQVEAGETVAYQVETFNLPDPAPEETARVSWLVKSTDGAALTHLANHGPVLELEIPASWAGETAFVMPYMSSPSTRIAVRTAVPAALAVPAGPVRPIESVEVTNEGRRFYASVDGAPRFYLGNDVRYGSRRGLMNWANAPGPRYDPADYEARHGDWAWYLLPTATAESRRTFTCLNTYDRARFTFGFYQYAAHTPGDNFVMLLRELLALPLAAAYFPDLELRDGCCCRRTDGGSEALEGSADTSALMSYFNALEEEVDPDETDRAARIVDWCVRDPEVRALQVDFAVRHQRAKLARHAAKVPLDGLVDKLCLAVLDVLHQGRGGYSSIRTALAADDPFDALLAIRASTYRERVATVRAGIRDLEEQGHVGRKVYDRASNSFVEPLGA